MSELDSPGCSTYLGVRVFGQEAKEVLITHGALEHRHRVGAEHATRLAEVVEYRPQPLRALTCVRDDRAKRLEIRGRC